MRTRHLIFVVMLAVFAPALAGCADGFDPDKFDVFGLNEKKKLPGERRPVFPEGVPGVQQGVPAELVKGYQSPPEENKEVVAAPVEKPKPRPRVAKRAPTRVTVQPADKQQQTAPWPDQQPQAQQQQAPWPSQAPAQSTQQQTQWPAPPPSGTFSR